MKKSELVKRMEAVRKELGSISFNATINAKSYDEIISAYKAVELAIKKQLRK